MNSELLEQRVKAFDHLFDAVVIVDTHGNITDWNHGSEVLYGYTKEEIVGKPVSVLHAPEDVDQITSEVMLATETTGKWSREIKMAKKDGSIGWIESMCVPVHDSIGQVIGTLGVNRDITERVEAEAELREAKNKAELANKSKSNLITTISHELRTPLTSIIGSLRLLMAEQTKLASDTRAELLELAWRNSDRLATLVDEIVNIEQLEAGAIELRLQPLDLIELLEETVQLESGYASEYGVDLVLEKGPARLMVKGDRKRLLQIMANLVSNACKFSSAGDKVMLCAKVVDGLACVRVADQGSGIPAHFGPTIFDKYVRAQNGNDRNPGGAGLGLSITKSLIELHHGEIGYESQEDKGTTFFFTLPLLT